MNERGHLGQIQRRPVKARSRPGRQTARRFQPTRQENFRNVSHVARENVPESGYGLLDQQPVEKGAQPRLVVD